MTVDARMIFHENYENKFNAMFWVVQGLIQNEHWLAMCKLQIFKAKLSKLMETPKFIFLNQN